MEGVSDKTGWKGRGQELRDSRWDTPDPAPRPGPGQRKHSCAGVPEQVYRVGLLGAKTEIPTNTHRLESGNIVPGAFTPVLRQALDESSGQLRERKNGSLGERKAE